jgi:threonine dehydrogenase-like Zn-dependent dehydrogenase
MRALVYEGPRDLQMRELDALEPGPGEIRVRVIGCGVCGSDLHGYLGHSKARVPPLVLGHELAGTVEALGTGVDEELLGAFGCVRPTIVCGECRACRSGRDNLCSTRRLMGLNAPGGLAESVVVPASNLVTLPIEPTVDAAIVEVVANALHVVGLAGTASTMAISGGGCLGLLTLMVAKKAGMTVVLTELSAERREVALALGAAAVADPREQTLAQLAQTHAPEGADVAVDAVGLTVTRSDAIAAVAAGGRVVLLGLEDERSELDFADIIRREIALTGTFGYSAAEFRDAGQFYLDNVDTLRGLVVTEPLGRGAEVFAGLADRSDHRVKIVLTP